MEPPLGGTKPGGLGWGRSKRHFKTSRKEIEARRSPWPCACVIPIELPYEATPPWSQLARGEAWPPSLEKKVRDALVGRVTNREG